MDSNDLYPNRFGKQEDWSLVARRMIAERCLYGVDKNLEIVQLARLSMWIVTSAKDLPFTFLDHNLKYGDAVVGCNKRQIATFDWQGVQKKQMSLPLVNRSTKRIGQTPCHDYRRPVGTAVQRPQTSLQRAKKGVCPMQKKLSNANAPSETCWWLVFGQAAPRW